MIAIATRNFEDPRQLELRAAWYGMPLSYSIGKEGENEKLAEHEVSPYSSLTASEAVDKLYRLGAITVDQL